VSSYPIESISLILHPVSKTEPASAGGRGDCFKSKKTFLPGRLAYTQIILKDIKHPSQDEIGIYFSNNWDFYYMKNSNLFSGDVRVEKIP
jgi:hypothetical protein